MATIYSDILAASASGKKLLAILIDPEKTSAREASGLISAINSSPATHIFVGGSTFAGKMEDLIAELRKCGLPVVIFPGHPSQIDPAADAILLLSLISGRNPDYLFGYHADAAQKLRDSGLEIIPTGYVLVDGGRESAVARVTGTLPLEDLEIIVNTAMAGEMLGQKLIYLEAGSGALHPVSAQAISAVRASVRIPLIVGGGISTSEQLKTAYDAGADLVVIGTAFERDPHFFGHA